MENAALRSRFRTLVDSVACVLALVLIVQGASMWLGTQRTSRIANTMRVAEVPVGRSIETVVVADLDGAAVELSSIGAGTCRYVVIGSSSCVYSRELQRRWTTTVANEGNGLNMAPGWATLWVLIEEDESDAFFDQGFPAATYHARSTLELVRGAGVRATPSYLVLDRDGRVLRGGSPGGGLLPEDAFLDDCQLDTTGLIPELRFTTPISVDGVTFH